jgi:hypothetical protein
MADLITLTCPTCGGNLQVTNDVDRFVCAHCGNAHVIDPGVRVESLAGELDQMRLTMDIRQAEDSLAVLRKRKLALEESVSQQRDNRRFWRFLSIALPLGVVLDGIYEGASVIFALFLAILLGGFLLLVSWAFYDPNRNQREQAELRRVNDRVKSGDGTLSFLKQELQRVTDRQQAVKNN